MRHTLLFLLLCLMLTACRTVEHTTDTLRVVRDTVRLVSLHTDAVRTADSAFVLVDRTADTVRITERVVRWRDRIITRTDTVIKVHTDTLRVEEEHTPTTAATHHDIPALAIALLTAVLIYIIIVPLIKPK